MKYSITGNFQYDMGVYGLKLVLDFFEESYTSDAPDNKDAQYYIEVDKTPEEILELIFIKLIYDKDLASYFDDDFYKKLGIKVGDVVYKKIRSDLSNYSKDELAKRMIKNKSIDFIVNFYVETIFNIFIDNNIEIQNDMIKSRVEQKNNSLFHIIIFNFSRSWESSLKKIHKSGFDFEKECSFCGEKGVKNLSKDLFFFASSSINSFWFNEPSIFICRHCLVSNLAVTQGMIKINYPYKTNLFIYIPNLKEMYYMNKSEKSMKSKINSYSDLFKNMIEQYKLKKESVIKDMQIVEFFINPANRNSDFMELYILSKYSFQNIIEISKELEELFERQFLKSQINDKNIDLGKELLSAISNGVELKTIVKKYIQYSILGEWERMNNTKNVVAGFSPFALLKILEMHYKLKKGGFNMNEIEIFKKYGQGLRMSIWNEVVTGKINENTSNNKIITIANLFLNASKGAYKEFMENLTRIMIQYERPITNDMLQLITKENYQEIASIIALSVVSYNKKSEGKAKENGTEDNENTEEANSDEESTLTDEEE